MNRVNPRDLVIAFAAAVLALVIGWFAGGAARDVFGDQYETAIGLVETGPGAIVATPSPTPEATQTPDETDEPSPTAEETEEPTPTPAETDDPGFCDGSQPAPGCECDLEGGDWVWVCPVEPTQEPPGNNGNGNGNND